MNTTDKNTMSVKDKELQEDIKKLVLARIKAASDDLSISIGSTDYTKDEILKSVEKGDEVGKEIIEIQMKYLRDMAAGTIYQ